MSGGGACRRRTRPDRIGPDAIGVTGYGPARNVCDFEYGRVDAVRTTGVYGRAVVVAEALATRSER